mmetsp:Transcript_17906/g.21971  ORF Transcript_17906/g.21971 Transcript_17906/m.21971 type:complete len:343 (+) Transcript_17906:44-1072(+)
MPRGPGKSTNYNLDYSRFDAAESEDPRSTQEKTVPEAEMPEDFAVALRNMPPELQEAYRLAMISRSTGDEAAQIRANELVLQAIEKGGPEVRKRFMEEVSQHLPEGSVPSMEGYKGPDPIDLEESADSMLKRMDKMKAEMEAGREATRKQLDALQKQQESLQSISSPEDFVNFMQKEGMSNEDIQRMLTDPGEMEELMSKLVNNAGDPGEHSKKLNGAEEAAKEAEELHQRLCGEKKAAKAPEVKVVKKPEVILPNHRLQYSKNDDGKYTAMELVCELPGVQDMSCIVLDIAEKHVRLNTIEPAPRYAVNAGPFPVLIEPAAARAKFSKKRNELSIMVPAKV